MITPLFFPSLAKIKPLLVYPPEQSWMLSGWLELTSFTRPGWRAFCETRFDMFSELEQAPPLTVFRVVRRGAANVDHLPVIELCEVAISPSTGAILVVALPLPKGGAK